MSKTQSWDKLKLPLGWQWLSPEKVLSYLMIRRKISASAYEQKLKHFFLLDTAKETQIYCIHSPSRSESPALYITPIPHVHGVKEQTFFQLSFDDCLRCTFTRLCTFTWLQYKRKKRGVNEWASWNHLQADACVAPCITNYYNTVEIGNLTYRCKQTFALP